MDWNHCSNINPLSQSDRFPLPTQTDYAKFHFWILHIPAFYIPAITQITLIIPAIYFLLLSTALTYIILILIVTIVCAGHSIYFTVEETGMKKCFLNEQSISFNVVHMSYFTIKSMFQLKIMSSTSEIPEYLRTKGLIKSYWRMVGVVEVKVKIALLAILIKHFLFFYFFW